jgi:hypothetical protein
MIGMAALAVDMGQAYNAATELGNAADAAALAGATQLDGTSGACLRAIAAATNANLANVETFVSNPAGPTVFIDPTADPIANTNIRFLSALVKDANGDLIGDYITDAALCDGDAEYIEVTVDRASLAAGDDYRVNFSLAPIVGVTEAFPVGYAVAGLGSAYCGIVPMMMCELTPLPPDATGSFWDDLNARPEVYRGRGLYLKSGDNSTQWGSGDFGFLSVEGDWDCGGACQLQQALGAVNPPMFCLGTEDLETEPGNNSGARKGFNTRFDIWMGDIASEKGNVQFQPAVNTLKGKKLDDGACALANWSDPVAPYTGPGSYDISDPPTTLAPDATMPHPKDNCAYPWTGTNPTGGTCMGDAADNSDRMSVAPDPIDWDLDTYLAVNQYGVTEIDIRNDLRIAATDPLTRFMVYKWEMGYNGAYGIGDYGSVGPDSYKLPDRLGAIDMNIVGVPPGPLDIDPQPPIPQVMEYGGPQCFNGPMGDDAASGTVVTADRRTIKVAVVDCESQVIKGKTKGVESKGFIEVFLLTPWQVNGGVHEIYTEIIGPVDEEIDQTVAKVIVQLYE